jgi:hypothetical protein
MTDQKVEMKEWIVAPDEKDAIILQLQERVEALEKTTTTQVERHNRLSESHGKLLDIVADTRTDFHRRIRENSANLRRTVEFLHTILPHHIREQFVAFMNVYQNRPVSQCTASRNPTTGAVKKDWRNRILGRW